MYSIINVLTGKVIIRFDVRVHAEMFINHCDPMHRYMEVSC
jgi:hypothetical protein